MNNEFNLLILLQSSVPEVTVQTYVKAAALLTYPEIYLKTFTVLERPVYLYMSFAATLQAEAGAYIKSEPLLQREVFPYIKFELTFPPAAGKYIKTIASMRAQGDLYIRAMAQFMAPVVDDDSPIAAGLNAEYIKLRAALTTTPVLGDLGDIGEAGEAGTPSDNKRGLLSRHYLSVHAVKKEV